MIRLAVLRNRLLTRAALGLVVLSIVAVAQKAPPWEKPLVAGKQLYRDNCVVCHAIEEDKPAKLGPNLHRFFQNELTPLTKAEPTEAYLRIKTQFGGDLMPAFVNRLSERNIDDLVEYIRSAK